MCRACFLHPCFQLRLWTASQENTGEGGTPALFVVSEESCGDGKVMTAEEWQDVDDAFIAKMDALDSHELVDLLWKGDDDAWRYVHARSVLPLLKRASLGRIVRDRNRSDLDICTAVFDYMVAQRKLEQYDHRCPVVYWIRFWVLKDILGYCRKNDNPMSDEPLEDVLKTDETAYDGVSFRDELNWCYMQLQKENKIQAKVLYLRAVEGRSPQEVMELLHISSRANVDQLYSRAKEKMRGFLHQSRKPKSVAADDRLEEMEVSA